MYWSWCGLRVSFSLQPYISGGSSFPGLIYHVSMKTFVVVGVSEGSAIYFRSCELVLMQNVC